MKSFNSLADMRVSEKQMGLYSKIKCTLSLDGVFNPLPYMKKLEDDPIPLKYSFYILGAKIENGKYMPKKLTGEQLAEIEALNNQKSKKKIDMSVYYEEPNNAITERSLKDNYMQLEDENKHGSIQFGPEHTSMISEIELKKDELVLYEECVMDRKFVYVYMIQEPDLNDEELKKAVTKLKSEEAIRQHDRRVFIGQLSLKDFNKEECMVIKSRVLLEAQDKGENESFMYVKLEVKVDINLASEQKQRYFTTLYDITRNNIQKTVDLDGSLKNGINKSLRTYHDKFQQVFKTMVKENPKVVEKFRSNGLNNVSLNSKERSQLLSEIAHRMQIEKHTPQFKNDLALNLSAYMVEKNDMKSLSGVAIDDRDKIYNETYCFAVSNLDSFIDTIATENVDATRKGHPKPEFFEANRVEKLQKYMNKKYIDILIDTANEYAIAEDNENFDRMFALIADKGAFDIKAIEYLLKEQLLSENYGVAGMLINKKLLIEKNNYENNKRVLLLFMEEEKFKESVILMKYIKERYPEKRFELYLYFYMLFSRNFEGSIATDYYYAKIKRMIEVKEGLVNLQEVSPDKNPFYPNLSEETPIARAMAKKTKEKALEQPDETEEASAIDIDQLMDEYVYKEASKLIELGFVKTAKILLYTVHDQEAIPYKQLQLEINIASRNTDEAMELLGDLLTIDGQNLDYCIHAYTLLNWCELQEEPPIAELEQHLASNLAQLNQKQQFAFLHLLAKKTMENCEYSRSIEVLNVAVRFFTRSPHFNYLLGSCLYNLGEYDRALEYLGVANFYDNQHCDIVVHILLCLDALGLEYKFNMMFSVLKKLKVEDSSAMEKLYEILRRKGLEKDLRELKRNLGLMKADIRTSILESIRHI